MRTLKLNSQSGALPIIWAPLNLGHYLILENPNLQYQHFLTIII